MSATPRDSIEIRAATPADIDAVLELWDLSGTHRTLTDDPRGIALLLADAPGSLLMAVDGERTVGTVIAAWNGWRGGIYRIAVAPSHRRLGLARALLAAATERLRKLGARRIDAFVLRDDPLARAFWDGLSPDWVPDPQEKVRYIHIV
jgi:ribosomal protein S18 acetylase RimI-like enzyme